VKVRWAPCPQQLQGCCRRGRRRPCRPAPSRSRSACSRPCRHARAVRGGELVQRAREDRAAAEGGAFAEATAGAFADHDVQVMPETAVGDGPAQGHGIEIERRAGEVDLDAVADRVAGDHVRGVEHGRRGVVAVVDKFDRARGPVVGRVAGGVGEGGARGAVHQSAHQQQGQQAAVAWMRRMVVMSAPPPDRPRPRPLRSSDLRLPSPPPRHLGLRLRPASANEPVGPSPARRLRKPES